VARLLSALECTSGASLKFLHRFLNKFANEILTIAPGIGCQTYAHRTEAARGSACRAQPYFQTLASR
jgi:hypothetical protein